MGKSTIRLALVLALLVVPVGAARADEPGGDTTPPTLYLPGDFTEYAWGPEGAWVWWWADAWDDVDGWVGVGCEPGMGSLFPIGQTTVECLATDLSGNTATGSFTVTVLGLDSPPTLFLPGPLTVDAWDPSGADVWYEAYAYDARGWWLPADCSPPPASRFSIGETTVNCTATDAFGNTATGSFTITVVGDEIPPTLHLPGPITVDSWSDAGVPVWYEAWASDNRDWWVPVTCTPPPFSTFPIGTTTVECTATDFFGNTASGSFTVTVLPPVVITLKITGGTVNPSTGVATIHGTVACTRGGQPAPAGTTAFVGGSVTQRAGRTLIRASYSAPQTPCSGSATSWSAETGHATGLFTAGSADVTATAFPGVAGQSASTEASVKLKAKR